MLKEYAASAADLKAGDATAAAAVACKLLAALSGDWNPNVLTQEIDQIRPKRAFDQYAVHPDSNVQGV